MKSYDQWSWTIKVHEIHIYMIFGDPSGQTFALILTVCHKVLAISLAWDIRLKCTFLSKIFSKEKLCDIRFLFQEAKIIIRTSRMATTAPPGSDNNVNSLSWLISCFQMFSNVFKCFQIMRKEGWWEREGTNGNLHFHVFKPGLPFHLHTSLLRNKINQ